MLIGNSLKIFKEFWPHIFPEDDCIHPRHYAVQVQPMTSWTTEIHCTSSKNTFLITGDWDHYSSPTREIRKIVFHCLCLLLQLFKYASWSDHQTWEHPPPTHTHTEAAVLEPQHLTDTDITAGWAQDGKSMEAGTWHFHWWAFRDVFPLSPWTLKVCPYLCLCRTHLFSFDGLLHWPFRLSQRQSDQHSLHVACRLDPLILTHCKINGERAIWQSFTSDL